MILYLVRHGESTWNVEGRLQGQTHEPRLTERGRAQAQDAGRRLQHCEVRRILSSDLARAVETAEILGEALGLPVGTTPLLREQALGDMEGKIAMELRAEPTPPGEDISEIRWGGGESLQDVWLRLSSFVDGLRDEDAAGDAILVSHGDTLRVLLALLDGRSHREVDWAPIANGQVLRREL